MSKSGKHRSRAAKPAPPGQAPTAPPLVAPVILPEPPEPRADKRRFPIWFLVPLFGLLYWGNTYVVRHGADLGGKAGAFPTAVYDPFRSYEELDKANPFTPEQLERTKSQQVYNFLCIQCHQANGQGLPGQFPPLAGSDWVQAESPTPVIRMVLNGLVGPIAVKGQSYTNTMPPWKSTLTDEQIAHVLSFVRGEWGNNAPHVKPEEVIKVREELKARESPFTSAELTISSDKAP